jgi:hypothetical protein
MKKATGLLLAWMLVATLTVRADAQIFTPSYMPPLQGSEVGIYVNDGPGNFSIEGIWRRNLGDYDLGFRGGIADAREAIILLGAELLVPWALVDVPVQMAFTAGVQGAIGSGSAAGVQGGITIGHPIPTGNFTLVPYVHPRLAAVSGFGRDDLELDALVDIGFDLRLPQNLIFRIGFGLGSPTADWGIGFSWR